MMQNQKNLQLQLHNILNIPSSPELLFLQWQEEYALRQTLRHTTIDLYALPLETNEHFYFYKRTFYDMNQKESFFLILMNHLTQSFWNDLLSSQSSSFIKDFFKALQQHLTSHTPNIEELKTLIRLFTPVYTDDYLPLLRILEEKDLKFLLDKTSNSTLRTLILDVLKNNTQLEKSWSSRLFSMSETKKNSLLIYTIQEMEKKMQDLTNEINLSKYFQNFLIAGKISELFQLLGSLLQISSKMHLSSEFLHSWINMVLPFYAIIQHPENSFVYAQGQYKLLFPNEKTFPSAFLYLHLFHWALRHQSFSNFPFKREFSLRLQQIIQQRPDDPLKQWFPHGWENSPNESTAEQILNEAKKRLENAPHETWVLLEILYCSIALDEEYYSPHFLEDFLLYVWELYTWTSVPVILPSPEILDSFSSVKEKPVFKQIQNALFPKKI